jgi:hypothetical protein
MQWSHYILMVGGAATILGSGLAYQQATLHWAQRVVSIMSAAPPAGSVADFFAARRIQDAITPPWLTAYLMVAFLLALSVVAVGFYFIGWIAGLVGLFGGLAASGIVRGFWPRPHSPFYRRHFIRVLRGRVGGYAASGDALREEAAQYFISALEECDDEAA